MTVYYSDETLTLLLGNAEQVLSTLDAGSVNCVVTSPPYYGLRDYEGNPEQIGLEETPAEYVAALVDVFAEVWRVLADDGTLWLNLGDSYSVRWSSQRPEGGRGIRDNTRERSGAITSGVPEKNLFGIPWRVAFALQDAGWILRNAIVWHKPNAMPESVRDRLSTRYELLFLLTKGRRYWFDLDPIRVPIKHVDQVARPEHRAADTGYGGAAHLPAGVSPQTNAGPTGSRHRVANPAGRNPGDVWEISTSPMPDAHFAPFPLELPRRCILTGCRPGGTVLDPFSGAGTTALAAQQLGRRAIGIDINAKYHDIALKRMADAPLPFGEAS